MTEAPGPPVGQPRWHGLCIDTLDHVPVPGSKAVKTRIHRHVRGRVGDVAAAGATVLWELPRRTSMADPEGNAFHVLAH